MSAKGISSPEASFSEAEKIQWPSVSLATVPLEGLSAGGKLSGLGCFVPRVFALIVINSWNLKAALGSESD
jgi:hypothetical protein